MNAPLNVTASGIYCAIKMIADPTRPRPAQLGLLAPDRAAGRAGHGGARGVARAGGVRQPRDLPPRVRHAVRRDGPAGPERVMACSQGTSAILTLGGVDYRTGGRYVSYETIKGGFGARPTKDGINGHVQRHLEHDEHADRDSGDVVPRPRGALRASCPTPAAPAASAAAAAWSACGGSWAARAGERVPGADEVGALRPGRRRRRRGAGRIALTAPDGTERRAGQQGRVHGARPRRQVALRAPGSGGYGAARASAIPRGRARTR